MSVEFGRYMDRGSEGSGGILKERILRAYGSFDPKEHMHLRLPGSPLAVQIGVPIKPTATGGLELEGGSHTPRIYRATQAYIADVAYPDIHIPLKDIVVIEAHGSRVGNRWKFADGQDVVDTVTRFNQFSTRMGLPSIDIIISCNRASEDGPLSAEGSAELERAGIIFAPVEVVDFTGGVYGDEVHLSISAPHGFANVDKRYALQHGGQSLKREYFARE